jgi:peptide/nickel transport system substrate-binding protein
VPPHIDRLVWRIIPDNSAQQTELRTGAADIILSARAEQAKALDSLPDLRTQITPSRRYVVISWNERRPLFRDARVRRALALAINRAQMLQLLRSGYGTLAASPIGAFQWMYDDNVKPLPYDTVAARALLDSAHVKLPVRFDLRIPANNQFNADMAEMIRADLDRIGVKVQVRPTEFATLIEEISAPERPFDAVLTGFEVDYVPDFRELFHSRNLSGPMQIAQYRNARMDSLLDAIAVTTDRNSARPLWSEVQRKIRDEQPWTVLWFAPQILVMREHVKGVDTDIRGWLVNVTRWRVE